jgi:drug/metabolite transporter (DMT)-like permease
LKVPSPRTALFIGSIVDILLGVVLIAFPEQIIANLGLPVAFQSVYLAIGGAAFVGLAVAKAREANEPVPSRSLLLAGAVTELLTIAILAVFLLTGRAVMDGNGPLLYSLGGIGSLGLAVLNLLALRSPRG